MPAAKKGPVELAVRRDLALLPKDLAGSGLAASAVSMAQAMDHPKCSFTARSMCRAGLADAMRELRELAPPVEKKGELHDIKSGRALRLAAGKSGT